MSKIVDLPDDFLKTFIKHIKFVSFIGIDVFDDSKSNFFKRFWKLLFTYAVLVSTVIGQFLYLFLSHKTNATFLDVVNALPGTLMATQDIVKLCIITAKRNDIRRVIYNIAELWPTNNFKEEKDSTLCMWTERLHLFQRFFYFCGYIGISFYLAVPLVMTIYTGFTEEEIIYQFPLDTYFFSFLKSNYEYAIAYLYISVVAGTVHMCLYIATDFILTSLVFDVSGLLAALQNDFTQIDEKAENDLSVMTNIVKKHQKLLSVVEKLNHIFGPLLFTQVTFSSIVICCFGFLTIVGKDLIKSLLATFGIILAMYNFCWSGQLLSDTSSDMADAAYNCAWYTRDKRFRKYILAIITRAQKPCTMSALGFSDVTLSTLSTILSTSWSYLSLLNQMYEDIDVS